MSAVVGGVSAQVPVAVSCWVSANHDAKWMGAMSIRAEGALLTVTFRGP